MQLIEQATNDPIKRRVLLHLVDATDGITPETAEAGTKCKVSLNYAAPADSVNGLVAFDTVNAPGDYYLELTSQEIRFPGMLVVRYKSAATAHFVQEAQVVAFNPDTWRGPLVGGGGPDIDYKRIKKLVDEAVGKLPAPVPAPETDFQPVLKAIKLVLAAVHSIDIPESKDVDLTPLMTELKTLEAAVRAIRIPETDLAPILEQLSRLEELKIPEVTNVAATAKDMLTKMQGFFLDDVEEIKTSVDALNKKFDDMPYVVIDKTINKQQDDGLGNPDTI
jgi:hypothetical protein